MTPPVDTTSSSGQGARVSSEWSSIQRLAESVMLRKREEAEEHECPKNFKGISKSMEASAILNMVEDAFLNRFFVIDIIVSDDDSTMRAVLKHPSKGDRGQVLKSPKGKLHTEISEPAFLADPSHRVNVVAKHIFSIVNESRDMRCG